MIKAISVAESISRDSRGSARKAENFGAVPAGLRREAVRVKRVAIKLFFIESNPLDKTRSRSRDRLDAHFKTSLVATRSARNTKSRLVGRDVKFS